MRAGEPESSLVDALIAVHTVLDSEGVEHALCGGIAANLYRDDVRATIDVDLCIVCAAPQLVSLANAFEDRGWQAHPAWRQAELLRLERENLPRVDLLVASTDLEREAVERAVPFTIDDDEIRVLLPEDLIVFKLVAGRARDYEAVAAILNASAATVDRAYVEQRLGLIGMEERWERALEEAAKEAQ